MQLGSHVGQFGMVSSSRFARAALIAEIGREGDHTWVSLDPSPSDPELCLRIADVPVTVTLRRDGSRPRHFLDSQRQLDFWVGELVRVTLMNDGVAMQNRARSLDPLSSNIGSSSHASM